MLPLCEAVNSQVPAFSIDTVVLATVQTLVVSDVTVTVSPDVAMGETSNVDADHGRLVMASKEMDCDACEMSKLCDTEVAAL